MAGVPDPHDEALLTRNWTELVQEIRATQTGAQILTAFLLTVPFSDRFAALDDLQRASYLVLLTSSVATTGFLLAPVAFHRILFRRRRRAWLVASANQCARIGLVLFAFTMTGVVFLVFDLVLGRAAALVGLAVAIAFYVVVWGIAPLILSARQARHEDRPTAGPWRS